MTYTVKEFARLFHTTEHTIRYYTDIGLLSCTRDSGNHRIFDEAAVNWMKGITYLKKCGIPIKDIKTYCDLCHLEETEENLLARYRIIVKQREEAHKKVAEAMAAAEKARKKNPDFKDQKLKYYEKILEGRIPADG